MSDSILKVKDLYGYNTPLVGDIKGSGDLHPNDQSELFDEIASLMKKYKVTKIDVCLDPWKFKQEQS